MHCTVYTYIVHVYDMVENGDDPTALRVSNCIIIKHSLELMACWSSEETFFHGTIFCYLFDRVFPIPATHANCARMKTYSLHLFVVLTLCNLNSKFIMFIN